MYSIGQIGGVLLLPPGWGIYRLAVGALVAASHAGGRLDALEKWVRALTQRDVWRLVDPNLRGGGVMTGYNDWAQKNASLRIQEGMETDDRAVC